MFYTVVGHAAIHYASETPAFRQEQMVQLVACPTVSPSILNNRFRIPEFPAFLLLFSCKLQLSIHSLNLLTVQCDVRVSCMII